MADVAIRFPRPPWLPLWGSCHEVTERVKTPSPPLRGTSPKGRGKALIRLALAGDARATFPAGEGLGLRIVTGGNPWKGPHQCEHWLTLTCVYDITRKKMGLPHSLRQSHFFISAVFPG